MTTTTEAMATLHDIAGQIEADEAASAADQENGLAKMSQRQPVGFDELWPRHLQTLEEVDTSGSWGPIMLLQPHQVINQARQHDLVLTANSGDTWLAFIGDRVYMGVVNGEQKSKPKIAFAFPEGTDPNGYYRVWIRETVVPG